MNAVAERKDDAIVTNVGDPMVSMIERIVLDPNVSIEKLEKMLSMKERLEDRALEQQARLDRKEYFAAMAKCQSEMTVVKKNKRNEHTNSNYADLAAIVEQAMPIVHKHGFTASFQPDGLSDKGALRIKWTVAHEGGHIESDVAELPMDAAGSQGTVNKTAIHAFGSTTTYGRRYLLCMLFNISTGDDNDGNTTAKLISSDQYIELRDLLKKSGTPVATVLKAYGATSLEQFPLNKLASATKRLNVTIKQKDKK